MIENKFKKSEIGLIPKDWKETPIGLVANIINGSTPPTADAENYGGEYLFVSPADLGEHKYIVDTIKKLSSKGFAISRRLPNGSILYTCTGSTIGKCGIASCELTSNQQINAILPNDSYNNEYLYYAIQTREQDIRSNASVQAVPLINKAAFSKTLVAFPEKDEQSRIATALSDVDQLIETLKKLIEKKRNIKQGVMQELLSGKRRLQGFTDKWVEIPFKDIYKYASEGGTPDTSRSDYYNRGDIPFVKIEDTAKKYIDSVNSFITTKGLNNSSAWLIPQNNIIFTNGATVGNVAINRIPVSTKQGILGVILKEEYDLEFIYYILSFSPFQNEVHNRESGGTFATIILKNLDTIPLFIPKNKAEQSKIAKVLSDMDSEISMLESRLTKYQSLKQGMMQQLLTGKIRLI